MGGNIGEIAVSTPHETLFKFFEYFPMTNYLNLIALFLMFIFLVTSADSACFVLGIMSDNGNPNPSKFKKLIWGVIMGVMVTAALISKGGVDTLKALAITGAIPFTFIMLFHCYCLIKALFAEK